jgi:hypothetical protein
MRQKYNGKGAPPNQTVVNAFIIGRVPASSSIRYGDLLTNLGKDIVEAKGRGFNFYKYSRQATPECMLRFIIERGLLSYAGGGDRGAVSRNDKSEAYMRRLHKRVTNLMDKLPLCDPLTLLAGSAD